jgi:hypothetical protein
MFVDRRGGVAACSLIKGNACPMLTVTNNIVAGATFAGFVVPGHDCGTSSTATIKNNIAHSIEGSHTGGNGHYVFAYEPSSNSGTCFEATSLIAYKCANQGVFAYSTSKAVVFTNMTSIDNNKGLGPQIAQKTQEYENLLMQVENSHIFGESEIPDCPSTTNGDYCMLSDKMGVWQPVSSYGGRGNHPTSSSALPVYKVKSDGAWGGKSVWRNNTFKHFGATTALGKRQTIIGHGNAKSPDYTPMMEFYATTIEDTVLEGMATCMDPHPAWGNVKDCGMGFPCTAPNNVLYSFQGTIWAGTQPSGLAGKSNFQIIHNNTGFAPYISGCTAQPAWNGYLCEVPTLSILQFESQDADRMDRAVQPVNLTKQGTYMLNVLNAQMDHVWDGFYTGQVRATRFPAIVDAASGSVYDIVYTGTPPVKQLFTLISQDTTAGFTAKIAYPNSVSYAILKDGAIVEMNEWSDLYRDYGPIRGDFCGENRYVSTTNTLEFYISQGCDLFVEPRDAI